MEARQRHLVSSLLVLLGITATAAGLLWGLFTDFDNIGVQGLLAGGVIALALAVVLERELLTGFIRTRRARYGAEALLITIIFVVIVVLANYMLQLDQFRKEWDVTADQSNTLAPETLDILANLPEQVTAVGFFVGPQGAARDRAQELLERYRAQSDGNFDFVFYDPQFQIGLAQEYDIDRSGQIVLEMGDRREPINFVSEDQLTGALFRLINRADIKVYFSIGHQELDRETAGDNGLSQAAQSFERINYAVESLSLLTTDVPEDASVVMLAGPQLPLDAEEAARLIAYLEAGGAVVYLQESGWLTGIEPDADNPWADYLAAEWGITLRDDVVIEIDPTRSAGNVLVPVAFEYGVSPITDPVQGLPTFFPAAQSIELGETPPAARVVELINSSDSAYGTTDFDALDDALNEGFVPNFVAGVDATGPLLIAVSVERSDTGARLIVVGDADFAINASLRDTRSGNVDLLLNMVKWAVTQEELITLTRDPAELRSLNIVTQQDKATVLILSLCAPVLLVVVAGIAVWWARRERVVDESV